MGFGSATCNYCNIAPRDSRRAFYIRLMPGGEYVILCDRCHSWTKSDPPMSALISGTTALSPRGDDLSRLLKAREFWAAFAHMCRQIARFSSAGDSHLPAFSRKFHLSLVWFATTRLPRFLRGANSPLLAAGLESEVVFSVSAPEQSPGIPLPTGQALDLAVGPTTGAAHDYRWLC